MAQYVKTHVRKSGPERRQEILDATMKLIGEHGMEAATVGRIAAVVGVTPGALYRHFHSRSALVAEANRLANQRSVDLISASSGADELEQLENAGRAHAAWAQEYFNTVVRPFFIELASAPDPEVSDRLVIREFASFRAIVEMAEKAKEKGLIRPDVAAEDVAWAFHMVIWAEDMALMAGEHQAITGGTFQRLLARLLDSFRAEVDEPRS
jgi:AcrR family transcriptional regulator